MSLRKVLRASTSAKALGFLVGGGVVAYLALNPEKPHESPPPEKLTADQQKSIIPFKIEQPDESIAALGVNKVPENVATLFTNEFNTRALRSTTETQRLSVVAPKDGVSLTACIFPKQSSPDYANLSNLQITSVDGTTQSFSEGIQHNNVFRRGSKLDSCEGKVAPHNDVKLTLGADGKVKYETAKPKAKAAKPATQSASAQSATPDSAVPYTVSAEAVAVMRANTEGKAPPNSFANTAPELEARMQKVGFTAENARTFARTRAGASNSVVIQEMAQPGGNNLPPTTAFARLNSGVMEAVCMQKGAQIGEIFKPVGRPIDGQILWQASSGPEQLDRVNATYGKSCEAWLNNGQPLPKVTMTAKPLTP